jgi:phosphoribosylaminoimidazolecarboxamide formyltransferase / IMP cyclohydrolase
LVNHLKIKQLNQMSGTKKIDSALISVYDKTGIESIVGKLAANGVRIISTGGTYRFLKDQGYDVIPVEDITTFPSILGGRVKTLHPLIFGGILGRREHADDKVDFQQYNIPSIDLVIVDLYPFEETLKQADNEQEIIEKIDIGGISLIRAAAKNFADVMVVPSMRLYPDFLALYEKNSGNTSLEERRYFASQAFKISSHYDTAIFNYFNRDGGIKAFKQSMHEVTSLRYGENPHQDGNFFGDLREMFDQLNGKAISYNNLNDIDAAINLIDDFDETTAAILKHNNACGIASRTALLQAWQDALAGDPVSAFGGVIVTNVNIDKETAAEMNKLFFEVLIAPGYDEDSLEILKSKKNRIILRRKQFKLAGRQFKSLLNGVLEQAKDLETEKEANLEIVTQTKPAANEISDLLFANKIVKHTKSNAIVLVKNKQLAGSGTGQTSRVDAVKQAIQKAGEFGFDLNGAVMASDAFFPFSDSIGIAAESGITAVIQPGGSIRDNESLDLCNKLGIAMAFTGIRHFKH